MGGLFRSLGMAIVWVWRLLNMLLHLFLLHTSVVDQPTLIIFQRSLKAGYSLVLQVSDFATYLFLGALIPMYPIVEGNFFVSFLHWQKNSKFLER